MKLQINLSLLCYLDSQVLNIDSADGQLLIQHHDGSDASVKSVPQPLSQKDAVSPVMLDENNEELNSQVLLFKKNTSK